jgi:hypothetical protein
VTSTSFVMVDATDRVAVPPYQLKGDAPSL